MAPLRRASDSTPATSVHPIEPLAPTPQRLLTAAWQLLLEGGAEAVTLRGVAARAGERMSSITYHFGSKQGLFAALIDYLVHDFMATLERRTLGLPANQDRPQLFVEGVSQVSIDHDSAIAWLDVLPLVLRDDVQREKTSLVYEWYRATFLRCMGVDPATATEDEEALAVFTVSVMDGLAIQHLIDPRRIDITRVNRIWRAALSCALKEMLDSRIDGAGESDER